MKKIKMKSVAEILKIKNFSKPNDEPTFDNDSIRPTKKRTRLFIDNEYFGKGYAAMFPNNVTVVYSILAKYAHHQKQICFPARTTIMREGGIKNPNTLSGAIKILEAHNIIGVNRSKGRVANRYILWRPEKWKSPNRIIVDTVKTIKKSSSTVSKLTLQPYQKQPTNRINSDTRNHINKSSNEIGEGIENFSFNDTTSATMIILKNNYPNTSDDNLFTAYKEVAKEGLSKLDIIKKGALDKYIKEEILPTP